MAIFQFSILNFTAQLWSFNGLFLLNKQETYLNVHKNSKLSLSGGRTSDGTQVDLGRYGSKVSEIMNNLDGAWKYSRYITDGANQWFTLHNVRSKRYLTATGSRSMEIQGQLCQSVSKLMKLARHQFVHVDYLL